jgi:hypothetical protein
MNEPAQWDGLRYSQPDPYPTARGSANGNAPGAWLLGAACAIRGLGEHGERSNDVWLEGKGLPIFQSCGHRS